LLKYDSDGLGAYILLFFGRMEFMDLGQVIEAEAKAFTFAYLHHNQTGYIKCVVVSRRLVLMVGIQFVVSCVLHY